jgi:hypothetical protein
MIISYLMIRLAVNFENGDGLKAVFLKKQDSNFELKKNDRLVESRHTVKSRGPEEF